MVCRCTAGLVAEKMLLGSKPWPEGLLGGMFYFVSEVAR